MHVGYYFIFQGAAGDWLGDDQAPLEGFPWRGGTERETSGILMWSEPFEIKLPNGDEVRIKTLLIVLFKRLNCQEAELLFCTFYGFKLCHVHIITGYA